MRILLLNALQGMCIIASLSLFLGGIVVISFHPIKPPLTDPAAALNDVVALCMFICGTCFGLLLLCTMYIRAIRKEEHHWPHF